MFSKLVLFATTAFALLAAAAPGGSPPNQGGQCKTGTLMCCKDVQPSNDPPLNKLLGFLGVVIDAVIPIGLTCSPITVIGAGGGATCEDQPVCCDQSDFGDHGGLLNLGCTGINLSL